MNDSITVKGAREHNLKNVNLKIPKNKLILFTGISGSGKSSMAFDTIYAEGQRRYVESLSSYARQFLGMMHKPDVDFIEGLSPAISIDQKSRSSNPRSTVGTITEIYDYFRLLFAKVGHPFCPKCGTEISRLSTDEMTDTIVNEIILESKKSIKPENFEILSPIVRDRKGEFIGLFDNLVSKGYTTAYVDRQRRGLDENISLIKTNTHTVEVVVDTVAIDSKQAKETAFIKTLRSRIFASVEQSLLLSGGLVYLKKQVEKNSKLFSQNFTCPKCSYAISEIEPRLFSFNSPHGACPQCKGLGVINMIDPDLVLNRSFSIKEGAILAFTKIFFNDTWFSRVFQTFLKEEGIPDNVSISELGDRELTTLLHGTNKEYRVEGQNRFGKTTRIYEKFRGIIGELERRYNESTSDFVREEIAKYMRDELCDKCGGRRLNNDALSVKINGLNIFEYGELPIDQCLNKINELKNNLSKYEEEIANIILKEINSRLLFLQSVGLVYLTLNRGANTLSGGESQRIRLASQIGSGLSGVIYVLDEPSIGLHPKDVSALVDSLKNLRDLGNTIVVVEHDVDTIKQADYIVDFGPKAGVQGGEIVFQGTLQELKKSDTITSKYLFHKKVAIKPTEEFLFNQGFVTITGCSQFNLKRISVQLPIGKLSVITGVSGSGKSTLLIDTLYKAMRYYVDGYHRDKIGEFETLTGYEHFEKVYLVDQSPIGKTPRSNPVTYIGVFDEIRELFASTFDAKLRGYSKSRFSFNVRGGRCEKCQGGGSIKIEMQFLPDVYITCDVCGGTRYNHETLEVKFSDKSIYNVLKFSVGEALQFFSSFSNIVKKLEVLKEVGLSYLELGQPAPTLSGGEAQRIKLASELSRNSHGRTLYILDEPTTGLHMYDVEKLLHSLYKLVGLGNTVVVIEHNTLVIENSQYIVDLGPEGGDGGGKVIYQGPREGIKKINNSYTARYLS
ncbi:excinuclease ABC subunit A [Candidatus Roizmanbacteria bacterium RIFCSPLOWO2_01_FULL_39_19]|nr:MAG: excinuclease ABC subunit A [Candidatus Roizmanbacteria bacterium RIFCSPLOWO2_01_FULL_39_19]